jgi:coenzyme Q-binding protein COQ10
MPQFSSKRRVQHTASQMFDLVADVERYPEFVPLCKSLKIRQRTPQPNGTEIVIADMTVSWSTWKVRSAIWKTAGRSNRNPTIPVMSVSSWRTSSRAGCWHY